jgi:plastocyanin
VVLALLSACSGGTSDGPPPTPVVVAGDGTVTVRADEWDFEPAVIQVQQGREITILLQNDGRILHNLKLEDLHGELIESVSSGPQEADEGELFVAADSANGGTLVFRPLEAGSFAYYCTLDGHRGLGMEGTLRVVP